MNKQYEQWIHAYLEDEISDDDLKALHQAIQNDPSCRRRFQADVRLHTLMREALVEQIELNDIQDTVAIVPCKPPRYWVGPVLATLAACITISMVIVGVWTLLYSIDQKKKVGTCLHVAGGGEVIIQRGNQRINASSQTPIYAQDHILCGSYTQAMLSLDDGTIVSMEPLSQLALRDLSTPPHVVLTKGEALFEVAERQAKQAPFQIKTDQAIIDVLGTTFTLNAEQANTALQVYEGRVKLKRRADGQAVAVDSEYRVDTAPATLQTEPFRVDIPQQTVSIMSLTPTDTITLEGNKRVLSHLKVKGDIDNKHGIRTAYLRFDIPKVGQITSAKLRMTQAIDPGEGTLTFSEGNHSDWSERSLQSTNAPQALRTVTQRTGAVQRRETIEVDVSTMIEQAGPATIIVSLDKGGGHDIWFHPRASKYPPQLVLTYLPSTPTR